MSLECMFIVFPDPMIVAIVNPSFDTPLMAGRTGTTLTCDVSGANNLSPTITYQWTKDSQATVRSETLTLSPLRLSHAGVYTCSVNVNSSFLNNIIIEDTDTITVTVPSELICFCLHNNIISYPYTQFE